MVPLSHLASVGEYESQSREVACITSENESTFKSDFDGILTPTYTPNGSLVIRGWLGS
jgi:hypothetical protein